MDYQQRKQMERKRAEDFIASINAMQDPDIMYKVSHPITDLKDMMNQSVARYGADHVAFKQRFVKGEPFREITYGQTLNDMNALGTAMLARGLRDKRVAIIGDNCYQWASTYLAVTGGVGVVVPLDKELGASELEQLIIEAECEAIFFTKKFLSIFTDMRERGETKLRMLVNLNAEAEADGVESWSALIAEGREKIAAGDRSYLDAEVYPDEMGVLLFTSGTTGIAKGVMLSQTNICCDLMSAPTLLDTNERDTFFSVLPIHHTYECTCGFLMPMYKGACIGYCEGLKYIQKNLQEIQPTFFLGVPLIFESLYKTIWKNIRKQGKEATVKKVMKLNKTTSKFGLNLNKLLLKDILKVFGGRMDMMIAGGAAIDPQILQFFRDLGIMALQGYGLTECAPMAALNQDIEPRNDSVGHVLPGMEVMIADKDEDGIGEICLKGPNVMLGYYHMPEETAKVIVDGWFHTGDLGYTDGPYIYITGRKKNVIITANGKNVFPEELEYYLGKSTLVSESMVWASQDADGQDAVIVATIKPDMEEVEAELGKEAAQDPKKVEALLWSMVDKVNANLPLFKKIRRINVRKEDFEKTTGKKIKRFVESNKQQ